MGLLGCSTGYGSLHTREGKQKPAHGQGFGCEELLLIVIMEKKMETTKFFGGLYRDNGRENGNYYRILGL